MLDKELDGLCSDATAILACLSPLAMMVVDAKDLGRSGAVLRRSPDPVAKEIGSGTVRDAAAAIRRVREALDSVMQNLGDYFNNHDACSESMTAITAPAYEMLEKRREGLSLDD